MGTKFQELDARLREIQNLNAATGILDWDQQVNMPPGGVEARASQIATLSRLAHELFTADETARLLEEAADEIDGADYDSDEASLVRVVKVDYDDAVKLPPDLVAEIAATSTQAHEVWANARANNDFAAFAPMLQKLLDLTLRVVDLRGYDEHPYDALISEFERGITTAQVQAIFDGHKPALIDLIAAVSDKPQVDDSVLHQTFDVDRQREFGVMVAQQFGYDFDRGRLDISVHPFSTSFSRNDSRITTRYQDDFLNPALFGTMHETGHSMYEQGVGASLEGTPLCNGTSLGVHESQSRMWENMVGRSRNFWQWALPRLKNYFPNQVGDVDLDTFYKAINKVERSFIRVEADEATYNLHIMLRFELEIALISGDLKVADLAGAWNDKFNEFFGITPPNEAEGVLQDIHWSMGAFGYFPTYALGNLLAAQYYTKALAAHPSIPDEIAEGKFDTLRTWLNEQIHQHGRKFTSDELTRRVTGESIQSQDYIQYLQTKFGDIYDL